MITYIPIAQLYPHWDNPRKDLGDLSELAESIKARGVLQNLTVVPGHKFSSEEWGELSRQYRAKPTEELRQIINGGHSTDGYTVVIGHRRLAASKMAGLTELPCVISDMDYKTQVGTMLLENMQRSDLTVYEQAKGFQMMLDLGDTVFAIAEQTGFSETTVRKRVKLLELDETDFRESQKRNVSLEEYSKLNKIEDVKLRNTVLKNIGTNNFDMSLQRALDMQKKAKKMAVMLEQVKTFATEIKETKSKKYIKSYYDYDTKIEIPNDAGKVKYYYTSTNYGAIGLYCDDEDMGTPEEQEEEKQADDKRKKELKEESERAETLRENFIKNLSDAEIKKHLTTAIRYLVISLSSNYVRVSAEITKLMGILDINEIADDLKIRPERYLVVCTYNVMESMRGYNNWRGEHDKNPQLDELYEFLKEMGYEMSDDEKALQDGTHRLFQNE